MQPVDRNEGRIYVPESFDRTMCDAMYSGLSDAHRNLTPKRGSLLGYKPFYFEHIVPKIRCNVSKFYRTDFGSGDKELPLVNFIHEADANAKILERFLKNDLKPTSSNISFYKTIYCYLSLVDERYIENVRPHSWLTHVGAQLGRFLRDPVLFTDQMTLASKHQRLMGAYAYASKNVIGLFSGGKRCIAFVSAPSNEYLYLLDFNYNESNIIDQASLNPDSETLNLYYGFCIPGHEFSPIVMKSWRLGERASGLVYSQDVLLDADSDLPKILKMDFLTTDRYQLSKHSTALGDDASVFASARAVLNGPRVSVTINKISNVKVISHLESLIDSFIRRNIK